MNLVRTIFICVVSVVAASAQTAYVRVNQVGYQPRDTKKEIAFSREPRDDTTFQVRTKTVVQFSAKASQIPKPDCGGNFSYFYELDFSRFQTMGALSRTSKKILTDSTVLSSSPTSGPARSEPTNSLTSPIL